ncbi:MAG: hypothetical protein ABSB19_03190 [Methylomonas sp.]|jgi:hypothetical protein
MNTILEKLFPSIMFFGTLLLSLAIFSAMYFYVNRIKPSHIVRAGTYVLILIAFVAIALLGGWDIGTKLACSPANSPDHCGVWGFLITAPISGALGIFLAELALYRKQ